MDVTSKLIDLLKALLEQAPSLLTLVGCIVLAIVRWKRHPKVSLMLVISLGLLFVHGIAFSLIYNWVPGWFIRPGAYEPNLIRNVYLVIGLISNTFAVVIFALLLAAVFMQRRPAT